MWQSRFPLEKIKQIQNDFISKGLANTFYQEYMCAPIDPQKAIFKREYFKYFKEIEFDLNKPFTTLSVTDGVHKKELRIKLAKSIVFENLSSLNLNGCAIFTTCDISSGKGRDKTAYVTFAIDGQNRIFIIDITSGFFTPFERSVAIIEVFLKFNPQSIGIEKAGMQNDFFYTIDVIQKLTGVRLPIRALSHGGKVTTPFHIFWEKNES